MPWETARRAMGIAAAIGVTAVFFLVRILGSFRSLAPLWCCQDYPACFSTFSCFVGQRSCQNFALEIEQVDDRWDVSSFGSFPQARVGQGSLLSGMSGVTAQDARYASLKRNERAQSTNGL